MKLRQKFPNKDLAYRFEISISTVSTIINTWIQYLCKVTSGIRVKMFPSRELIQKHLPAGFKSFKNTRVVIDCFEIFVQSSRNFAEQGNMYSSYKNHATLKCLFTFCSYHFPPSTDIIMSVFFELMQYKHLQRN